MDIAMMGSLLTALVSPLILPVFGNSLSSERVAKSINWLISTANEFLKARNAVRNNPEGLGKDINKVDVPASPLHIDPTLEEYLLRSYEIQMQSYLDQLSTYLGNIRHLQTRIADTGGTVAASIADVNQLKRQRQEVGMLINQLHSLVNTIYSNKDSEIEKIAHILTSS